MAMDRDGETVAASHTVLEFETLKVSIILEAFVCFEIQVYVRCFASSSFKISFDLKADMQR